MTDQRLPVYAILSLGLTQIIGYGTLYYSFSVLAPSIAGGFQATTEWVYGILSIALLAGGVLAPWLGKLIDRLGAAQIMTVGSAFAALALILCATSPNSLAFIVTLTIVEIAANLVQYGAAFALLVQIKPMVAQRSIVYLTLIAGFASTIFWPLTSLLLQWLTWQQIYLVFAGLHLVVCLPLHYSLTRTSKTTHDQRKNDDKEIASVAGALPQASRRMGFTVLLAAFSLQALISSAILVHMIPLLSVLGLAKSAAFIGAVFGPSQVASRMINMIAGKTLSPVNLAIIAASFIALSVMILMIGAPYIPAAILFACLFGFGNGLFSIISGSLPLFLFGSTGYGAMQGKLMSARLVLSAIAPFAMAFALKNTSVYITLAIIIVVSIAGGGLYFIIKQDLQSRALN